MADVQPAGVSAVEFLKPYGRGCLAIQLAAQYFCDLARVGLSFGGLHHLTYQGIKGPIAAGMVLLNNFRVGGNGLIDHGFNGTTVADLLVTALFNDAIRSEERRVGKECRSRWSRYRAKKKKEG